MSLHRFLSLSDVADLFGIPEASLYRQRYTGDMPGSLGFKVGRHVRFDPADLERWVHGQKMAGRSPPVQTAGTADAPAPTAPSETEVSSVSPQSLEATTGQSLSTRGEVQ